MNSEATPRKKVGILLIVGILFLPFIFAWALLRRGYSNGARAVSFGWMVFVLAAGIAAQQQTSPNAGGSPEVAEAPGSDSSSATAPVMYVTVNEAEERDAPNGTTVNRIYRGQRVDVAEAQGEWVRVTKDGFDPRWVRIADLSKEKPPEVSQPQLPAGLDDARLGAIPKVGEYGHTEADVLALRTAALELLNSGQCAKIEDANKSVNVAGVYYLNCGEASNRFFKMQDGKPRFCSGHASTC